MNDSKRFLASKESENTWTIFVRLSKTTTDIETELLILCTEIESLHRNPITDEVIIGFRFSDQNLETRWAQAVQLLVNAGCSESIDEPFWAAFERV